MSQMNKCGLLIHIANMLSGTALQRDIYSTLPIFPARFSLPTSTFPSLD